MIPTCTQVAKLKSKGTTFSPTKVSGPCGSPKYWFVFKKVSPVCPEEVRTQDVSLLGFISDDVLHTHPIAALSTLGTTVMPFVFTQKATVFDKSDRLL
jgi:hypothetical protein